MSCDHHEGVANLDSEKSSYSQFTSLLSVEVKKLAYATLTRREKSELWVAHLRAMVETHKYSEDQTNLIKKGAAFMLDRIGNDQSHEDFISQEQYIVWKYEVSRAFSSEERFSLFASIGPETRVSSTNLTTEESNECHCSSVSDWCNFLEPSDHRKCYKYHCKIPDGRPEGCGDWWDYKCDGSCGEK